MSYGLKITNPGAELVISSDAKGLYCIGKAVLQGSVVQPSGTATAVRPGRTWGGSTYRILHTGPIIAAIDLPLNKTVGVMAVTQPFAGAWDIACYCGDTPDSRSFDAQYAVDVWAFGFAPSVLGGFAMDVFDASGALAYDLSRPAPLWPRGYALGAGSAVTIPSLTRPVVLGCPATNPSYDSSVSTNRWAAEFFRGAWKRTSSTSMYEALVAKQRWEYSAVDPLGIADGDVYKTPCFLIEGNLLP